MLEMSRLDGFCILLINWGGCINVTFEKMHIPLLSSPDRENFLRIRQCVLEGEATQGRLFGEQDTQ